jgi:hypothetical protein
MGITISAGYISLRFMRAKLKKMNKPALSNWAGGPYWQIFFPYSEILSTLIKRTCQLFRKKAGGIYFGDLCQRNIKTINI